MSYCTPCRRHLNGALSCPGCGRAAGPAPGETADPLPVPADEAPSPESAPPRRTSGRSAGRSARRQGGRGKVLAASAAGLVVCGLATVLLAGGSSDGAVEPASADTGPPSQSAAAAPGAPTAPAPATTAATATARPQPSATTTRPKPSGGTASATASVPVPPTPRPADPPAKPSPSPTGPNPQPSTTRPPTTPVVTPTCDRFLFWCT
ncbi:hypothetical protein [Streptomyces sp. 1114.5]|uniref:hypothetical protein n=1 Tax=Streptomyces sp. 1114.5 TaxID=1938830 RepID=UPI000EB48B54|nr:hypothetical protein [Streptomyces sp. 1114.5]